MSRTTVQGVKDTLGPDFKSHTRVLAQSEAKLSKAMVAASIIVDNLVTKATAKEETHTSEQLQAIEESLAAHLYVSSFRRITDKKTGDASAKYEQSSYLNDALMLDHTGLLSGIMNPTESKAPDLLWLGTVYRDLEDWQERNL